MILFITQIAKFESVNSSGVAYNICLQDFDSAFNLIGNYLKCKIQWFGFQENNKIYLDIEMHYID